MARSSDRINPRALDYPYSVAQGVGGTPIIAVFQPPDGVVGEYYEARVQAVSRLTDLCFTLTGLPSGSGLQFDNNSGILSGYPAKEFRAHGLIVAVSHLTSGTHVVLNGARIYVRAANWLPLETPYMLGLPGHATRATELVPVPTLYMLGLPGTVRRRQ